MAERRLILKTHVNQSEGREFSHNLQQILIFYPSHTLLNF